MRIILFIKKEVIVQNYSVQILTYSYHYTFQTRIFAIFHTMHEIFAINTKKFLLYFSDFCFSYQIFTDKIRIKKENFLDICFSFFGLSTVL